MNVLQNAKTFLRKNSATILTCAGAAGVIATSVMAVKATPKAMMLLEEAEKTKGEDLTKLETVKTVAPAYIPAAVTGVATIACIFGANVLNKRQQAAMTSAYMLVSNQYKEYKKKVDELYGEAAGIRVREEVAKDHYEETHVEEGKQLFYDYFSERYFEATLFEVQRAEYELNRTMTTREYAYLNEFYELLGMEPFDPGYELGWSIGQCLDMYWQNWIDFGHEKVTMDDGLECIIITMRCEPVPDFMDYA